MCDYNYTLSKTSASGFEFKTDDIYQIHRVLDTFICPDCKISKSQAEMNFLREWPAIREQYAGNWSVSTIGPDGLEVVDYNMLQDMETMWALPNNYNSLDERSKVQCLLNTPCGAEFQLLVGEETEDTIYAPSPTQVQP